MTSSLISYVNNENHEDFNPSTGCESLCNFLSFKLSCTNLFLILIISFLIYHLIYNKSI